MQDGEFVGVVAPTAFAARQAIEAVAKTAKWDETAMPSSDELVRLPSQNVAGGVPSNPFAADVAKAAKSLRATYTIAYVQHAPLEPRTAVAEWDDGKLTVWTATQNPFGVRGELAKAFRLAGRRGARDRARFRQRVRRQAHGRVRDRSRAARPGGEEAGHAALDARGGIHLGLFPPGGGDRRGSVARRRGRLSTWHHVNINAGGNSIESPYDVPQKQSQVGWIRGRRCGTVRIEHWRRPATRLRANRSWTRWPRRRARIRWNFAGPI